MPVQVQLALCGHWERLAVFDEGHGKLMREMGMTAAVASALNKAQVRVLVGIVDPLVV
jgi:hypothetical protein